CKSHAVSYGLIAWKAAYLKAHYPLPFWTAALNNNQGMYPRRAYIEAVKRAGLAVRLPCVNRSAETFTAEDGAIRTGPRAIGWLSGGLRAAVVAERQRRGPYRDLADLRRRVHLGPEALAVLIRCGALDALGRSRPALFLEAELQDQAKDLGERLFPDDPDLGWAPGDYDRDRRLRGEGALLGFIVRAPPVWPVPPAVAHGLGAGARA